MILTPESVQAVPALAQAKTEKEISTKYYLSIQPEGSGCVCLSLSHNCWREWSLGFHYTGRDNLSRGEVGHCLQCLVFGYLVLKEKHSHAASF